MRLSTLLPLVLAVVLAIAAAYVQWLTVGLPPVPAVGQLTPETTTQPYGFPLWIGITHYVNLLFMVLLARSGLQILMDHPRLYWNVHCTPGTEWIRFTPVQVPLDRLYTAKDDARYLTPWVGLPGGRHTLGLARHWHFVSALFWVLNGALYVIAAVRDESLAADRADLLAHLPRRLGHVRPLRDVPPAAGAQRLLPVQRAAATELFRGDLHPRAAVDPDRPVDVAGAGQPVQLVSQAAGQPAGRPIHSLPGAVRLRRCSSSLT